MSEDKNVVEVGSVVTLHYETKSGDEVVDSSYMRGEPITFKVGEGQTIKGFETAAVGLTVGERKSFDVAPEDGYGQVVAEAVRNFPKTQFPEGFVFDIGAQVQAQMENGNSVLATITEVKDEEVVVDFNHPYAGKTLGFEIEVLEIQN